MWPNTHPTDTDASIPVLAQTSSFFTLLLSLSFSFFFKPLFLTLLTCRLLFPFFSFPTPLQALPQGCQPRLLPLYLALWRMSRFHKSRHANRGSASLHPHLRTAIKWWEVETDDGIFLKVIVCVIVLTECPVNRKRWGEGTPVTTGKSLRVRSLWVRG